MDKLQFAILFILLMAILTPEGWVRVICQGLGLVMFVAITFYPLTHELKIPAPYSPSGDPCPMCAYPKYFSDDIFKDRKLYDDSGTTFLDYTGQTVYKREKGKLYRSGTTGWEEVKMVPSGPFIKVKPAHPKKQKGKQ